MTILLCKRYQFYFSLKTPQRLTMRQIFLFCFLLFSAVIHCQNTLAKIEYSYAEEAFTKKNYTKTLTHLNEVKKLLGSTNAKVMFLEIKALDKNLVGTLNTIKDYKAIKKVADLTEQYVTNFENEVPFEKLKSIYEIQKKRKPYSQEYESLINGKKAEKAKEFGKAVLQYRIACDANNHEACKNLSNIYYYQKNDDVLGKQLLEKALSLGSRNARYNKAVLEYRGLGGYTKETKNSVRTIEEAYNKGFVRLTATILGDVYIRTNGSKSYDFYFKAVQSGDNRGAVALVMIWRERNPVLKKKAISCIDSILATKPSANYYWFKREYLKKVEYKWPESFPYYVKGCEFKDASACNDLAAIIGSKTAKLYGQKKDKKKAKEYQAMACKLDPKYCTK